MCLSTMRRWGLTWVATSNTLVEDFQLALRVNLVGPNIMARETARRMKPGGVVANVASVAGLLANPHRNAYAASKAGLIATTKSVGMRMGSTRHPRVRRSARLRAHADDCGVRTRGQNPFCSSQEPHTNGAHGSA
ncbi:SDR family oxidoreductase [Rhizobium beringeri]